MVEVSVGVCEDLQSRISQVYYPEGWVNHLTHLLGQNNPIAGDLQYRVQWSNTDHEVQALLVQKLPSGVYVDAYQLETLRRDTGLEVLLDSEVDLEAPEYLSSGFTALVFLSGTHEAVAHGRYHRPSDSRKPVKVDMEPPRVLLRSDQCRTESWGTWCRGRGSLYRQQPQHLLMDEILDLEGMLIQPKCWDPGPQNQS